MPGDEPPPPRMYVFFDYNCPWSYVGKLRSDRLAQRFDIELVWCGWELHPDLDPAGRPTPDVEGVRTDPVEGAVGELAAELEETFYWPPVASNTRLALRGLQHARSVGAKEARGYHDAVFDAIWQDGINVGTPEVLAGIARELGMDDGAFLAALDRPPYDGHLEKVQEKAKTLGLVRRPTFVFGNHRIVGTDAFQPSLVAPLGAFIDRWRRYGPEETTTLEEDRELSVLRPIA